MRVDDLFQKYIKEIYKLIARGDAREESFYDILKDLIEAYGKRLGKKTEVTILPKKSEAGNPDFRVWDGESLITGYIEAKHPLQKNLEYVETSEQLKRYREAYPNLILTNFLEFRLYRNGEYWKEVNIGSRQLAKMSPEKGVVLHKEKFQELLNLFFEFTHPRITTPRVLTEILSKKAKIMRDYIILPSLEERDSYFTPLYNSFKYYLLRDLTPQSFADLFAQTFTYGLFIAKYQYEIGSTLFSKGIPHLPFTAKTAYQFIQRSFGILREVFRVISTEDMPRNLEVIVEDIIDILNHTEIHKLLAHFTEGRRKDPIYHLYETFLFNYDPEKRKKLGVYYTPLEVVSFIVNSVHALLKDKKLFNAPDGLATYKTDSLENSVTLLEPAVGTGTFFVEAIEKAIEEVKNKYSKSKDFITQFIRNHILKHFFAFEILIAPYVVCHLKTLFKLSRYNFEFTDKDKLNIFLTNTLEFFPKETEGGVIGLFERVLAEEQEKALEVKKQTPILVIIGNPPYSVSSQNKVDPKTEFGKFYESYKEKVRKEEKNIQPLSDDYIKFLAFAHWKIRQIGKGIVGMITNNSYLDGLIHRDMRKKLLDDFDLIYILNLHGDAKRSKITKDGKKDENVFDIKQGVAIAIFVKPEKQIAKQIFYQELIGLREEKYKFLESHDVLNVNWINLTPKEPYWFFVIKELEEVKEYKIFYPIKDIFSEYTRGVVTSRDEFVIAESKDILANRINSFITSDLPIDLLKESFKLKDTKKWKVKIAQELLKQKGFNENLIYPYSYRPFDKRWIYYDDVLLERSRSSLMKNMIRPNVALVLMRQVYWNNYSHFFVTADITDSRIFISRRGAADIFPLWLYNSETEIQNQLLVPIQPKPKTSNIKKRVVDLLSFSYKKPISSEEIFYYIYAILYSDIYRQKYLEFLKIDFPRIPFTKEYKLFKKLSEIGKQLVELHLLKSDLLNAPSSRFEGNNSGLSLVKKVNYNAKEKRIYINDNQYFTNVEQEIWNYFIGGYQVINKWLKDRKGKYLTDDEIKTYIKIIEALKQTLILQKEIDRLYPEVEKKLINIQLTLKKN